MFIELIHCQVVGDTTYNEFASALANVLVDDASYEYTQLEQPPIQNYPYENKESVKIKLTDQNFKLLDWWARKFHVQRSQILRGLFQKAYDEKIKDKATKTP